MDQNLRNRAEREKDWTGHWWQHPYLVYIVTIIALFAFLVFMGYLAVENEWLPKR